MTMHKVAWYRGTQLLGNRRHYTHRIPARWADEIAFLLTVEGVIGEPSAASLRVVPQIAAMHTRNQNEDSQFATTQTPLWRDVTSTNSDLLDRNPGEVATHTIGPVNNDGTSCILVPFTMRGGYWTRLALDISTTAGETGGFQISLEAVLRG
ncbi:hypothetical protein PP509_gp30 [Gordonia phage MichaelScott]|uniref:Uncharacterized protein n=1 Tax=Gordonia phage MichaelScott TaxID=2759395 RepID=A0A7L7SIN1_9CAUD|nr:hypothetical protein PP509_gp30 [Gordonia phage MichaelScott]QOC56272.1 hypothetical protein SEA_MICHAELSCOTT_30 [Gordonia phage MichaelScott]